MIRRFIKWLSSILYPIVGVGRFQYVIKWKKSLSPSQMGLVIHNMIGVFPPNCKPIHLTAYTQAASLDFTEPCLSGTELNEICKKTLSEDLVLSITLDGDQIYPIK